MNLRGKRILVTGGAGFIGSHLVDQLADCFVRVLDDLSTGKVENLAAAHCRSHLEFVRGDIRDRSLVANLMRDTDVVFHLACRGVRHSIGNPRESHEVNAEGTLVLLQEARLARVERFVHVSSSEVYGTARYAPMDENHPTFPETVYGAAKLAGDAYARAYHQTYGLPTVVVRPFNNFGPRSHHEGDSGEVIPRFVVWALHGRQPVIFGDGSQTRDFIFVEDTAHWMCRVAECDALVGQTINLASGIETSVNELATIIYREVTGAHPTSEFQPRRPGDVLRHLADIRLAQQLLDFRTRISVQAGIKRLVEHFESQQRGGVSLLSQISTVNWQPVGDESAGLESQSRRTAHVTSTTTSIPITKPLLGPEEEAAAASTIRSGWLTQGSKVAQFERAVADYCGAEHAVAVSNCTTALHLALLVAGLGPGDEVICPSMSFIATCNSIRHTGAMPVFAEVDSRTFNLDPSAVEAAITTRTKAILVVHQIGLPADLDRFHELAARRGLIIVEDAACAIGSEYRGRRIGSHGDLVCFSFHPRKVITTGEGGMITTGSDEYAHQLRLLRQHGMSVSDAVRHNSRTVVTEEYVCLGYNYRMTDVQAAIGIEQMRRLDGIVSRRRELAERYTQALGDHPWLRPPYVPEGCEPNFQSYAVSLATGAPITRNDLMQFLLDRNISTRRGIMLAHVEPASRDLNPPELWVSRQASESSLLLPLYPQMTDDEQQRVITALRQIRKLAPLAA